MAQKVYDAAVKQFDEKQAQQVKRDFEKQFEACECETPMQAMFCMTGHMTECHFPRTCEEAECSHYEIYREQEKEE